MGEPIKKQRHFHILKRHTFKNGERIYFCTNNCDYKVSVKLALGKDTLCNICGKLFRMNEYSLRLARPRCQECINKKDTKDSNVQLKEKKEVSFDDLGIDLPKAVESKEIRTTEMKFDPISELRKRLKNASSPTPISKTEREEVREEREEVREEEKATENNTDDLL